MAETEYDCCESSDFESECPNNNADNGFQNHENKKIKNYRYCIKKSEHTFRSRNSSEDSNEFDGVTEVVQDTTSMSTKLNIISLLNEPDEDQYPLQLPEEMLVDIKIDQCTDMGEHRSFSELHVNKQDIISSPKLVNPSEVVVIELTHKPGSTTVENRKSTNLNHKSKKPFSKGKTFDDNSDYSYSGVVDRIKKLNTSRSMDSENNKTTAIIIEDVPDNGKLLPKKLLINPEFQEKMKDLYYPTPSLSVSFNSNSSPHLTKDSKFDQKQIDLNCEIDEENLSPVSTTARQLEQQLSFSSSPKSPALSPRIPKMTRFARLNRFLSASLEPDEPSSPTDAHE